MGYKKCPICDLNWILEDEECCKICKENNFGQQKNPILRGPRNHNLLHDLCKISIYIDTVPPNVHVSHNVTGYKLSDSKGIQLGVVLEDSNNKRKGRAVIRFYNEIENQYGTWHTVISRAGPVMFSDIIRNVKLTREKGEKYFELWIE